MAVLPDKDDRIHDNNPLTPDDDQLRHMTGINEDQEGAMDREAHNGAAADIAQREGLSAPLSNEHEDKKRKSKAMDSDDLGTAETAGKGLSAAAGEGLFNPETEVAKKLASRVKNLFWSSRRRKQTTIATGMTGIIVGGFLGLSSVYVSGPFQFIHIFQLLEHTHLADQQDAGNDQMGKLYRWLRSGGDIGETRIGYLGSKMKDTMLGQLKDAGFEPNYEGKTTFSGFTIDTTDENSPFHGMDQPQVEAALAEKGITSDVATISTSSDESITISANDGFLNGFSNKSTLNKFLVSQMDESAIPDAIRARVLAKYGFIDWHPLQVLKSNVNGTVDQAALSAWEKVREKFLNTGQEGVDINTTGAEEQETDANGKTTTTPLAGTDATPTSSQAADTLKAIRSSGSFKIAGGLAAAVGLVCAIKAVNDNIGNIRYAQDIQPLIRMGTEAITVGSQIMNGTDVDVNEVNSLAQQFNDSSGKNWSDSKTFQADAGEPTTGDDIDPAVSASLSETPPGWLSWVDTVPGLSGLCSGVGSALTGIASFTLGVFSGEAVSTVVGAVVGALAAGPAISGLSHLIAGDAVNVLASGPAWGNDVNYGTRLWSNAQTVQDGGTALSTAQVSILNTQQDTMSRQSFESKSIAYRLFSPDDYRSLLSQAMNSTTPSVQQNVNNIASSFLSIGQKLASLPLTLFSSLAHADPTTTYNYPFPQFGFSEADLNNPLVQDPYANADVVQNLLDNNNKNGEPDYIAEAATCFNVNITKTPGDDGNSYWDVIPGASSDPGALNIYTNTYTSDNCTDPPGFDPNNWLRLRFFIFDTGIMEGYACEQGVDNQSCMNDGFND